ncbi:HAMP domain-containing protein [Hyphomicrobium sp.]|jgi:two-component system sensor histidine kinase UhpB|uniref:HAMP domain-containing protein n=1 Tax=Hyphomicrobium sp. TaxID=82 RepID=UPI002BFC0840|nr:HAMP domain-containing protein [Hyphomicrobium sp.]HVZ05792.1 HAMP domain-containing protein [Hyphomicrobium sp.]
MSIQLRLNLAIALLSALGLFCMIAFILLDAKPRMEVENASTMLLTETLIKSSLLPLKDSRDPEAALVRLVTELKNLRHASVNLASRMPQGTRTKDDSESTWFSGEKNIPLPTVKVPVDVRGELVDTIVITPKPGDELAELWEAIERIFQWGVIISAVTLALTWLIINRSLRPIHALRDAMGRMEAGDFDLRVPETGPPEIKSICGSLNGLAAALQKARQENQNLTAHMIMIQDQERRDIARELHDELGPYLFAMRADGALLGRELEKSPPDLPRAMRLNDNIVAQVDLLQQTNRRVLQRLTPPGLSELGLVGALQAMVQMWRRTKSTVDIDVIANGPLDDLDETTTLTIYRIVQEGLTNAFRHSGADRIAVHLAVTTDKTHKHTDDIPDGTMIGTVEVTVRDNGTGHGTNTKEGFGLRAMRERVTALSGSFLISSNGENGTSLRVKLPATIDNRLQTVAKATEPERLTIPPGA